MGNRHNPPQPGHVLREWIPENMTITNAQQKHLRFRA